jgi:uncharacterized SAM-binding protein YcdF (DUF218 family)
MIEFERLLAQIFSPVPIIWIFLFIGLILFITGKKQNLGKVLMISGIVIYIFFSFSWITKLFLSPVESKYKPYQTLYSQVRSDINNSGRPVKWIVVLAAGISDDENLPITSKLSYATLTRVVEGIRLYHKFPGSKLIFSGGGPDGAKVVEADLMKQLALDLRIERADIMTDVKSIETSEQAIEISQIVKDDDFILVTSANHMSRAQALFNNEGMTPYILATDYYIKESQEERLFKNLIPNSNAFRIAETACYQMWARLAASIKGDI